METKLSKVSLNNIRNTDNHKEIAKEIAEKLEQGEINALDTSLFLKKVQKISEEVFKNKECKEIFNEAFHEHKDGKTFKAGVNKISSYDRKIKDYSVVGDPYWEELNDALKSIKSAMKTREAEIDSVVSSNESNNKLSVSSNQLVVNKTVKFEIENTETEVYEINSPLIKSVETLRFSV